MPRRKKGPSTILSALDEQPKKRGRKAATSASVAEEKAVPAIHDIPIEDVMPLPDTPTDPEPPKKRPGRPKKSAVTVAPPTVEEETAPPTVDKAPTVSEEASVVVDEAPVMAEEEHSATETKPQSRRSKKSAPTVSVHIQSLMGGDIELDTIISRVREAAPKAKDLTVYVKAEENKAYYTGSKADGSIDLW